MYVESTKWMNPMNKTQMLQDQDYTDMWILENFFHRYFLNPHFVQFFHWILYHLYTNRFSI